MSGKGTSKAKSQGQKSLPETRGRRALKLLVISMKQLSSHCLLSMGSLSWEKHLRGQFIAVVYLQFAICGRSFVQISCHEIQCHISPGSFFTFPPSCLINFCASQKRKKRGLHHQKGRPRLIIWRLGDGRVKPTPFSKLFQVKNSNPFSKLINVGQFGDWQMSLFHAGHNGEKKFQTKLSIAINLCHIQIRIFSR